MFLICARQLISQLPPGARMGRTRKESGTCLDAPGPLPLAALPTAREVYLAICFAEQGEGGTEEDKVETVAGQVEQQFNKVTPTMSVIKHKNTVYKINKLVENSKKFKWKTLKTKDQRPKRKRRFF
jgi:hypothetical protein